MAQEWETVVGIFDLALVADRHQLSLNMDHIRHQLDEIGVHTVHRSLYDTGLLQHKEVAEVIEQNPQGAVASLVWWLIEKRVNLGEYTEDTLKNMYGMD